MRNRFPPSRAAVAFCVALGCAAPASAFDFLVHVDITKVGMSQVIEKFIADLKQPAAGDDLAKAAGARPMTFTAKAIQEITDANKAQDTDYCPKENKENFTVPAQPCNNFVTGEKGSAFGHLFDEPQYEHFDDEYIQESSDYIYYARRDLIAMMKRGNFIGARKRLGQALHALQDFYAHTNYVELGYRYPKIDERIGLFLGSFRDVQVRPRLARVDEPTCLQGEYLFTNDLRTKLTEELKKTTDFAERTRILEAIDYLTKMLQDPDSRGLTSGFFRFTQTFGDRDAVNRFSKCRHGHLVDQPGINKDKSDRPYHLIARDLALLHTTQFIVDIMRSILADPDLKSDEKYPCIVGLFGYEPTRIITRVTVGIPGAPNGESWDTAIAGVARLFVEGIRGIKNIQPDIYMCMESATVPGVCLPLCDDADWSNELNAYVCSQPVDISGWGTRVEPDLRVLVREVDLGEPKRVIANFRVEDPRACDPFCSYDLEPPGSATPRPVWIRFELKPVTEYGGPRRPRRILPPADAIPIAKPASATATPASSTATPGSTTTPTTTPTALVSSATSATPGSSLSSTTTTAARTTTAAAAAAPLRTPAGIDSRLALRDADSCIGADAFYTGTAPASLSGAQGAQLYQMAAFSMAITDVAAKQSVLNAIRAKVGDDAFYTAMTAVIADPLQSQTLVTAYQNTARNVAQKISSSGLASLLPTPVPPSALPANVDRWILSRVSSPALVSAAIDLMSSTRPLTAECTINELAKQGFTAAVIP